MKTKKSPKWMRKWEIAYLASQPNQIVCNPDKFELSDSEDNSETSHCEFEKAKKIATAVGGFLLTLSRDIQAKWAITVHSKNRKKLGKQLKKSKKRLLKFMWRQSGAKKRIEDAVLQMLRIDL
jgi:hypothetical protein